MSYQPNFLNTTYQPYSHPSTFDHSAVEFIHSSEIIEFFYFLIAVILFAFTIIRIFVLHDDFNSVVEEPNKNNPSKPIEKNPNPPRIIQEDQQQDKIYLDDVEVKEEGNVDGSSEFQENKSKPEKIQEIKSPSIKKSNWEQFTDVLVFKFTPLLGIMILNIINFGTYIFLAFMTVFWFLVVLLINYLEIFRTYKQEKLQKYADDLHLVIIFAGFLNYFINNQNEL